MSECILQNIPVIIIKLSLFLFKITSFGINATSSCTSKQGWRHCVSSMDESAAGSVSIATMVGFTKGTGLLEDA